MKRPQLVPQGSLNRILQSAETAWNNRDFQQTIEELERAARLAPANGQILLQLGRIYGLRYDYSSAKRCFDRAIQFAQKKPEILAVIAAGSADFANHEIAEHYFQRALEQKGVSADVFAKSAEFHERLRRTEEAYILLDRALQLDPACPLALLARARLDRETDKLENVEKLLIQVLKTEDLHLRARGYYELGTILDRKGQYDEAMTAFLKAKALLQSEAVPYLAQLQHLRAHWGEMQSTISAGAFDRWFESSKSFTPNHRISFLGGYPRSGTTLLEQVLDSHPDAVSAEETTLFNDEIYAPLTRNCAPGTSMLGILESAQTNFLNQLRENYFRRNEQHLGSPIGTRLLVDKNPSINVLIPAFVRAFPEIKLLIALRDPRDVCLSCFVQAHLPLSKGNVAYLTIEGAVEGYTRVMGLWQTLAPMLQGHYLEVRYEEMVNDITRVSRSVLDFLGVPWNEQVLRFDEHARSKRVRSPTYADVAKPVSKRAVGRWRNYQKYLEPHLEKLQPFLEAFGYEH